MSDNTSVNSVERKYVSEYVYPEWFTEKKYSFYKKMLKRLKQLRYVHSQSAEYYEKMNFKKSVESVKELLNSGEVEASMDQQRKILDNLKLSEFIGERKLTEFSEESVKILSQNNF